MFSIDGIEFPHLRVTEFTQTFEILDGENAGRVISGEMVRDVIGTYYNYKMKISPEKNPAGMTDYNKLWDICSTPQDSHLIKVPYDVNSVGDNHSEQMFEGYITSGARNMEKYDYDGTDYWKEGEFNFIAIAPKRRG